MRTYVLTCFYLSKYFLIKLLPYYDKKFDVIFLKNNYQSQTNARKLTKDILIFSIKSNYSSYSQHRIQKYILFYSFPKKLLRFT